MERYALTMVTDSPLRQLVDKLRKYDVAHNFREILTIVFPRRLIAHTREIFSEVFFTHKPDHLKPDHENPSTRITGKKNQKSGKKRGWREKTKTSQKRVEQAPRVAASSMFAPQR